MALTTKEAGPRSSENSKSPDRTKARSAWVDICNTLNPGAIDTRKDQTVGGFLDQVKVLAINLPALSYKEQRTVRGDFNGLKRNSELMGQLKPVFLDTINSHSTPHEREADIKTAKLLGLYDDKDISKAIGPTSEKRRLVVAAAGLTTTFTAIVAKKAFEAAFQQAYSETTDPETPAAITPTPDTPTPQKETHPSAQPSPSLQPTEIAKVKATPTPELKPGEPVIIAEKILQPISEEAAKRRDYLNSKDSERAKRVDVDLNSKRVNFLILGYGEEHSDTYADFGGSLSFISLETTTAQQANINLSRDIRTPEEEQRLSEKDRKAMPIRYVYREGGFEMMRLVAERATGLSADFQIVMKDTVIRDLIQNVTGPIKIKVDKPHQTNTYRLGGKEYPPGFIEEGEREMDAEKAMQFLLAEDFRPGGREDERSYRKNILMKSMKEKFIAQLKSNPLTAPFLLKKAYDFFQDQVKSGDIILDFDPNLIGLAMSGVTNAFVEVAKNLGRNEIIFPSPEVSINASIHDPYFGDGSVSRVHNIANRPENERGRDTDDIRNDVARGYMPEWMLIPDGGNPYSNNLIDDYWKPIRELVKAKLTK